MENPYKRQDITELIIADAVLVELRAVQMLTQSHEAQLLNCLKATLYEVGR